MPGCPTSMGAPASVGVHDDLPAGEAGVSHGAWGRRLGGQGGRVREQGGRARREGKVGGQEGK